MHEERRLPEEDTPIYSTGSRQGVYTLKLKKQDCLAWVPSDCFKYRDFILEGRIGIDPENGYSSAGFIFRYINDENFYYFLVSTKRFFRFCVVFNGNPINLIEWTESPLIGKNVSDLRVIARGTGFSFYLDDEWIAEVDDETISEGTFGFAAQNYSEKDPGSFYLHRILVDSRPVEVEKAYTRWVHFIPARPEYRVNLAGTFMSMGRFLAAGIQLKKALRGREGSAEEYFMLAESYRRMQLYDQALESIEKCLEKAPGKPEALLEKANLLYSLKRFIQARVYIRKIIPGHPGNTRLWNILGNCEYSLGNPEGALEAYQKSVELDPEDSLSRTNAARTQECLGLKEEAFTTYLAAARLLFRQEAYDELSLIFSRTRALLAEGIQIDDDLREKAKEFQAVEGKMLYHEGDAGQAEKLFVPLIKAGYQDSAVFYLYGLILIDKGERVKAGRYLKKAAELEPSFFLYWSRLAENLFLLGEDPEDALKKAYRLNPDDPWVNNLFGQHLMEKKRLEQAVEYFRKAKEAVPGRQVEDARRVGLSSPEGASSCPQGSVDTRQVEDAQQGSVSSSPQWSPEVADIYLNYSECLARLDFLQDAVIAINEGLDACGEHSTLFNQRGNILVRMRDFAAALNDYEKAIQLDQENNEYPQNAAACCIELDMIMRAEELLGRLLARSPGASVYNLTGNLAVIKGEYKRAELAFKEALCRAGQDCEIKLNLASLYLERRNYRSAKDLLEEVLRQEPESKRALSIREQVRKKYEIRYACASCDRTWWIPRGIPPQPALRIHGEPPNDAPAGKCKKCGKIYCVGCAQEFVRDRRFICPDCGESLKLADDALKYQLLRLLDENPESRQPP